MSNQKSKPICLFGAGGHGRSVAAQILRIHGQLPVFADDSLPIGTDVAGTKVMFSALSDICHHGLIVSVGSNERRYLIQERAKKLGIFIDKFIADEARYFGLPPGAGSVILSGAIVNSEAEISEGVIVNSGAIIEHGCRIYAYSHIAPGAVIAGDVKIGRQVWVGANATILQGLSICEGATIGAGAIVTRPIKEPGVYIGQPARRI